MNETETKIINEMRKDSRITYKKLSKNVGVGYDTIKEYIQKLKIKKVIKRIGSKRSGYWKIK